MRSKSIANKHFASKNPNTRHFRYQKSAQNQYPKIANIITRHIKWYEHHLPDQLLSRKIANIIT